MVQLGLRFFETRRRKQFYTCDCDAEGTAFALSNSKPSRATVSLPEVHIITV
jgi:hypothetical protein